MDLQYIDPRSICLWIWFRLQNADVDLDPGSKFSLQKLANLLVFFKEEGQLTNSVRYYCSEN